MVGFMINSARELAAVLCVFGLTMGSQRPAMAVDKGTNTLLFSDHFDCPIAGRWEQLKFGPPTDYFICHEADTNCLKAVADKTCSALMTRVDLEPSTRLIARWRWKIDRIPPNSTDHVLRSFDHTARVIIAFDTFIGPPRTVNYVWANQVKIGDVFPHPRSGRAQMIALESGDSKAGEWVAEERDVTADWHQLFGDKPMPKIVAIGVITDSEATGTKVTGCYQNIELLSK